MSKKATKFNLLTEVWKNAVQTLIALAFLLVLWAVAHVVVGNELLVPNVGDCLKEVGRLLADGGFWRAFFHNFTRVLNAFVYPLFWR